MNYHNHPKRILGALAAALLSSAASSQAALSYHVEIVTGSLSGSPASPFSLDLQLNGPQGNTATVSNFTFGGGSAGPGAAVQFSGVNPVAAGSLATTVTLDTLTEFFNEFYQEFTPGTILGFDVSLSENYSSGVGAPDVFAVAILDDGLGNIPTTAGFGNALFVLNIDDTPTAESYRGADASGFEGVTVTATPIASAVPDSGMTVVLLGFTLAGIEVLRRKLKMA